MYLPICGDPYCPNLKSVKDMEYNLSVKERKIKNLESENDDLEEENQKLRRQIAGLKTYLSDLNKNDSWGTYE